VVNLTRVTEKFMSSLLASMTGGVVSLDGDVAGISTGSGVGSSSGAKAAYASSVSPPGGAAKKADAK
jgi:hypothetical protein